MPLVDSLASREKCETKLIALLPPTAICHLSESRAFVKMPDSAWYAPVKDKIAELLQEANNARECLVPNIAALPLPVETSAVTKEIAEMYAALSGKDSWLIERSILNIWP